jgi:pilus assembly protein Flp/PilA
MRKSLPAVGRFLREEHGATMVEYALLVALIALVLIASVSLLGTNSSTKLNEAAQSLGTGS